MTIILPSMSVNNERVVVNSSDDKEGLLDSWKNKVNIL